MSERFTAQTAWVSGHDSGSPGARSSSANQGFCGRTKGAGIDTGGCESLNGSTSAETTRSVEAAAMGGPGDRSITGAWLFSGALSMPTKSAASAFWGGSSGLFPPGLVAVISRTVRLNGQRQIRGQTGHRSDCSGSAGLCPAWLMILPGKQGQEDTECRTKTYSRGKSDNPPAQPISLCPSADTRGFRCRITHGVAPQLRVETRLLCSLRTSPARGSR